MEVRRSESSPGLCSLPLRFTYVTFPFTASPDLARVLPSATMSLVKVPCQACPVLALAELKDEPSLTVAWLPEGMVPAAALRNEAASTIANAEDLRKFIIRHPPRCFARTVPALDNIRQR